MDAYQTLAQTLLQECPAGYESVQLKAELDDGWVQMDLRCKNRNQDTFVSELPGDSMFRIQSELEAIRDEMSKQGGKKWKKCVFVITPDKKFKINVEY